MRGIIWSGLAASYSLGAITSLTTPSGIISSLDHCELTPCTDLPIARAKKAGADLSLNSPTVWVTILIPVGLARCCRTAGTALIQSYGGGLSFFISEKEHGQRKSLNSAWNMLASIKQSEHSSTYSSSTLVGGLMPASSDLNVSVSTIRQDFKRCNSSCAWDVRAVASAISFAVSNLYFVNSCSAARASRLCATSDPVVVTTAAAAAIATPIPATMSQKSHQSPLWPRNRVEAAAFALSIVSVIGGLALVVFGIFALCAMQRKP
jgi:hypothetical protein